jgi:AraC-like DNA-binding protein
VLRARGHYFGDTLRELFSRDIVLTDTRYTQREVGWHSHEGAYFTLLLEGRLVERTARGCTLHGPGDVLYHPWEERHANELPTGTGRGFHVELRPAWFEQSGLGLDKAMSPESLESPLVRMGLRQLHRELSRQDPLPAVAIESRLVGLFQDLRPACLKPRGNPGWVHTVRELLHETDPRDLSLGSLAASAGIHPVHLSRSFPRYFGRPLSEYLRFAQVEHAVRLLQGTDHSIAHIAQTCGFFDQSHLVRSCRRILGETPSACRRNLRAG